MQLGHTDARLTHFHVACRAVSATATARAAVALPPWPYDSDMSLLAATWTAALAIVGLFIGAVITAWYARKAFREQSLAPAARCCNDRLNSPYLRLVMRGRYRLELAPFNQPVTDRPPLILSL